jgi:hypothetical protein
MTITQKILQHIRALTETEQHQVLEFVQTLEALKQKDKQPDEDKTWISFSLEEAMRGQEDDPVTYTHSDIRETFQ